MFDERRKACPNVNTKKRQPVLNDENITQKGKKKRIHVHEICLRCWMDFIYQGGLSFGFNLRSSRSGYNLWPVVVQNSVESQNLS